MSTPAPPDPPRAAIEHPTLQRTLRAALELTGRDLPEFDAALRRLLIARYRSAEGAASATPGSRAKAQVLEHEAAFRSALPRIVAGCLNAAFLRLGDRPAPGPRPEEESAARAAVIHAFSRRFPAGGPDGIDELDRRIAHQLGRATLPPGANPLRPAVFLHAIGVCWRTVAGSGRDELDVMAGYGTLWLPVLRRTIPELIAGLPPVPGSEGAASAGGASEAAHAPGGTPGTRTPGRG